MGALKTETIVVLGIALAVVYLAHEAASAAANVIPKVAPLIDPTSDKNLAYTGVNSIGAWLSGNNKFDLGSAAYDATHGGALDVTSSNNAVYSGVNGIGAWLSGNEKFDLGGAIYDWTH